MKQITSEAALTSVAFMEDGGRVIVGTSTGKLLVYDLRKGNEPVAAISAHTPYAINCLQFQSPKVKEETKKAGKEYYFIE